MTLDRPDVAHHHALLCVKLQSALLTEQILSPKFWWLAYGMNNCRFHVVRILPDPTVRQSRALTG